MDVRGTGNTGFNQLFYSGDRLGGPILGLTMAGTALPTNRMI